MSKDTGGPAFPVAPALDPHTGQAVQWPSDGMTLRDYFATAAMQGLMTKSRLMICDDKAITDLSLPVIAEIAYEEADAMLAERAK